MLFSEVLKHIIDRRRPAIESLGVKMFDLRSVHKNASMPSGDTAQVKIDFVACILFFFWFSQNRTIL